MASFKFSGGNMQYILTQISPKPVGLRDEAVLAHIENLQNPISQAEQVMRRKPFQAYNDAVAFVMCQFIVEKCPPTERPDSLINKYRQWIKIMVG